MAEPRRAKRATVRETTPMKSKRKPFSAGGNLYIVRYEDGRTAYCVIPAHSLDTWRAGRSPSSAYTFAVEGQSWGLIPKGKIVALTRAH
jgi:hypothetical protein